ncbi:MAG: hypothetical protein COU31_05265 [Candidatus Magasanikbacteria bacterium CG10_big_fil_rev_8_21_14_0_10_40_10]|uniref:Haloacid dehalogenase n=1 Tax=Candidatus Magasanikbacteria bacterium CG10_big_fil_rev_8_21_14_0_10_40_10 TaxID=1974648 RepID=A0A2M6W2I4_9BACT|nr:MAG: hypothetical protein COU31_05265 [Candidatus Magasanikbacteria bacterium CG10_big_fil_rev_8_21_14_0_10_40_10]
MIKAIITDFSHVLLFARDKTYQGSINDLYAEKVTEHNFDFWSVFALNETLFDLYKAVGADIPVYIFTGRTVQNDPAILSKLQEAFADIFSAEDMNLSKKETSTYKMLCETIDLPPGSVLYIDDKQAHVDIAKEAGLQAFQHISNGVTIQKLDKLGIRN